MKGYYQPSTDRIIKTWKTHRCDHVLYDACTLFMHGNYGLAVIQQRFNDKQKVWWWGPIDDRIAYDISNSEKFKDIFWEKAGVNKFGIYPTIEVRKLMYAVGLKPMRKEYWETSFRSLDS